MDSECKSIDRASNGQGIVVENQRESTENCLSEGAVPPENGDSEVSTTESKPANEILRSEGSERERFPVDKSEETSSICSDSKAEPTEDSELGTTGETAKCTLQFEEKATASGLRNSGGFQSSEGGGLVFDEEEAPPAATVYDNPLARPVGSGAITESNDGGSMPDITNTKAPSVDNFNAACTECQNLPKDLLELAERLSEPLGMAVATVFYEVFEQTGDFGTGASPVDELSGLLGAALKESLFRVLGNDRVNFVENFRNSFSRTYKTIRSVRRSYLKNWSGLNPRKPYPKSWRRSPSKSWRVSPSQTRREMARKNWGENYNSEARKPLNVENARGPENTTAARRPKYTVESISEEDITSFSHTRYRQQGERVNSPCGSTKSCLNESLQSSFFTSSSIEQDRYSDSAGSCSKSCLNESFESSFFTSSNPEQVGDNPGTARSNCVNSSNESWGSRLSEPTPDATDVKRNRSDEEDSWDDLFSATSASEGYEWVTVDAGEVISETVGHHDLAGPSDLWTFNEDDKHGGRLVEYKYHNPLLAGDGGGSVLNTSVGASNSLGNHPVISLQEEYLSTITRNPPGGVIINGPVDHAVDNVFKARSSQGTASKESRESSGLIPEPSMDSQSTLRRRDSFGRTHFPGGGNARSMSVHRGPRRVWGDGSQLTGLSLEDTVLFGNPPLLNYGVAAGRQTLLERYVEAQETQNHLKSLELAHSMKRLLVKKDHLQLHSESNSLMKENVDLSRSKVGLKEYELEDRKLTAAHHELSQMCADELVAGLFMMLLALSYGCWKFSYARLSRVVTMCQLPVREPRQSGWWLGSNWMSNSLDAVTWQVQALTCEVTKAGRMLAGLALIALVTSALLRRSVTSSSQTMPATIIVVVLAGICGFAGKISVDSLGGDGYVWLSLWELLCLLHVFATSCTAWLYRYLCWPKSTFGHSRSSSWMKFCSICARFSFHFFLVFVLPVMAGLLPFASLRELNGAFWEFWEADPLLDPF